MANQSEPKKTVNPIAEAGKLQAALAKVDTREAVAIANAQERAQVDRNELIAAASPAAIRILEASKSEVAG